MPQPDTVGAVWYANIMQLVLSTVDNQGTSDKEAGARIQRLLRRKQSEKSRLEREIREMQHAIVGMRTLMDEIDALQNEIHELFAKAIERKGLSAREAREVQELYEDLQRQGTITWNPAQADSKPCPFCGDCHSQGPFVAPEPEFEAPGPRGRSGDHAVSADKSHRGRGLRELYRDLALRFHPDRAEDDESRQHHETMMRKVNEAYHGGHTDKLLQLSKELGFDVANVLAADGGLAALVRQYETVKREVRELRNSPPGQLVVETRRARKQGYPTPNEQMKEEIESTLEVSTQIRDFVGAFVAGTMDVDTLIVGPMGGMDDDEMLDDMEADELADIILSALSSLEEEARAASVNRRAAKRNKKNKKNKNKRARRKRRKKKR